MNIIKVTPLHTNVHGSVTLPSVSYHQFTWQIWQAFRWRVRLWSHPTKAKEKQEHRFNIKSPLARHEFSIHLSSPKGLVVFCQWGVRGQNPGVFEAPYYEVEQAVMSTMSIND